MRPVLHCENTADNAVVDAVVRFRDELLADGRTAQAIGLAMIAVGSGALGGVREVTSMPLDFTTCRSAPLLNTPT